MSKGNRIRFTKVERRKFNNRPHAEEEAENICSILEIHPWKPVEGVEDFIKNGGISNKMKNRFRNKPGCKVLFPDNEPYENSKQLDVRFIGGEYPPSNLYGDEDFELTGRWVE